MSGNGDTLSNSAEKWFESEFELMSKAFKKIDIDFD